jgi:hypothetical protein
MASLNLLKANFTGALGQLVGVPSPGKNVVKSRVWHRKKSSVYQTFALTSFGRLNRISGTAVKKFWPYCGLSDKKMLKHNAFCKYFSPAIAGGFFDPLALQLQNLQNPNIRIEYFISGSGGAVFTLAIAGNIPLSDFHLYKKLVMIFDLSSRIFHSSVSDYSQGLFSIETAAYGGGPFYCWLLVAKNTDNKFSLYGSYVAEAFAMLKSSVDISSFTFTSSGWLEIPLNANTLAGNAPVSINDNKIIFAASGVYTISFPQLHYSADSVGTENFYWALHYQNGNIMDSHYQNAYLGRSTRYSSFPSSWTINVPEQNCYLDFQYYNNSGFTVSQFNQSGFGIQIFYFG